VKAIIMAGGFGTRLRPLTNSLPKPMVPVANKPIIDHIVELLKAHSFIDLTALLFFYPEIIEKHLADGSRFGVNLKYVALTEDLGTAGSVANAMRRDGGSTVLVISGDVLTDINLSEAVKFHKKKKSLATIILTRVQDPLSYGIVITDESGRIARFLEKPSWGEVFSDTINTGIYILEPSVLDYLPEGKEFDFSNDLFPALLRDGKPLYGYIADGYWKDVGNLSEYRLANMDALQGKVKVNIAGTEGKVKGVRAGAGARIDSTAKIEGSVVVGVNASIGRGARIADSVIGDNAVIEEDSIVIGSVVWNGARIGRGASLQENIVQNDTQIGNGAHLGIGAVVSDHCKIGRNATVKPDVKVRPHKEVEDEATLASSLIWGDRWSKNIFSSYGVTGLANIELSPEFAAKLGAAYGASLKKGAAVSTSRDSHKTSRMINRAIMTGILSTGVNVHDYGVTPMPVVRFLARDGHEAGGVHTRRSPFENELIDLKFFDTAGMDLHPGHEKSVERLFFREDFRRVPMDETGDVVFPIHAFETYQGGFLSAIDFEAINKAGFKIVLDYSYGSSSRIFPSILGKLNCEVIALSANIDGTKLTRTGEEFGRALSQLSTIVRSLDADMGFLLDAGGEKVFLVDNAGDIIDGETALNLITLLVLKSGKSKKEKGAVAVPVTASRAIEEMAESYGFSVVRTRTTSRGIMEAATGKDVVFVGEDTGGFIFPKFQPIFDGMYAIAKILEMIAREKTDLHKLVREIPASVMIKDRVMCNWENKGAVMRRLAEDSRGKDTTLIDGIRINFGDDWILAYPSQSHPYFHIVAEAGTEEKARELVSAYAGKIRAWQAER